MVMQEMVMRAMEMETARPAGTETETEPPTSWRCRHP
jgi:hypothetical protein